MFEIGHHVWIRRCDIVLGADALDLIEETALVFSPRRVVVFTTIPLNYPKRVHDLLSSMLVYPNAPFLLLLPSTLSIVDEEVRSSDCLHYMELTDPDDRPREF